MCERLYNWLYYSYSKNGFMYKICTVFCGDNPEPAYGSKGAWSHKSVLFKHNPGKKLQQHEWSDDHKGVICAKTNMKIEESISALEQKIAVMQMNFTLWNWFKLFSSLEEIT